MRNSNKQNRNTSDPYPHSNSYTHSKTNARNYFNSIGNSDAYRYTGSYSNSDSNTDRDA